MIEARPGTSCLDLAGTTHTCAGTCYAVGCAVNTILKSLKCECLGVARWEGSKTKRITLELGEPEEAIKRRRKNLKDFPLPAAVQVLREADRLVPRNVNLPPAALSL